MFCTCGNVTLKPLQGLIIKDNMHVFVSIVPYKGLKEKKKKTCMLAYYSHILLFSPAMNDVFLLFPIKYRRHGSVDTMKELDCSLLECIQLLGCGLCNGSLLKAELNGIMDGSDRGKQSVYRQNAFYYRSPQ